MKKKILHIISGLGRGGAENVLYRLSSKDDKFNHEILNLGIEDFYVKKFENIKIKVNNLGMKNNWFNPFLIFKVIKIINNARPHIIHTWMYHADLLGGLTAKLVGFKNIIWCVRNFTVDKQYTKFTTRIVIKMCSFFSKYIPKKIINCSLSSNYLHQSMGYPKNKCVVIANGVNTSSFKPDQNLRSNIKKKLDLENKFVIGFVARWDRQKDINTFINSLKIFKKEISDDWHVIMAGLNLDKRNLELVEKLKEAELYENTSLLGFVDDLVPIYNSMDICVLTSSYGEGFPNVIIEAMSCEVCCVASDIGDSKYIIGDNDFIFSAGNFMQLKNIFVNSFKSIENKNNWDLKKRSVRNRVIENFSLNKMIKNYQEIWEKF